MATRVELKSQDGSVRLVLMEFQGVLLPQMPPGPEKILSDTADYPYQDGDVIVCSYPKTGSNWVLDMVGMLRRGSVEVDVGMTPPLELMPQLSATKPAPRTLLSHLPYRLLPTQFKQKGRKLILVCRNPRDTLVSTFHYAKNDKNINYQGEWEEFLGYFMEEKMIFGGYVQYYRAWDQTIKDKDTLASLLCVRYEDFKRDCKKELRRICEFLELQRDDDFLQEVVEKNDIKKVKTAKEASEDLKPFMQMVSKDGSLPFYRKGQVGDWKNHFTSEQVEMFEQAVEAKLKDTVFKVNYTA